MRIEPFYMRGSDTQMIVTTHSEEVASAFYEHERVLLAEMRPSLRFESAGLSQSRLHNALIQARAGRVPAELRELATRCASAAAPTSKNCCHRPPPGRAASPNARPTAPPNLPATSPMPVCAPSHGAPGQSCRR